jgi:hypothetical protein
MSPLTTSTVPVCFPLFKRELFSKDFQEKTESSKFFLHIYLILTFPKIHIINTHSSNILNELNVITYVVVLL